MLRATGETWGGPGGATGGCTSLNRETRYIKQGNHNYVRNQTTHHSGSKSVF